MMMLERETLFAIPLSHHGFARRLLGSMQLLGFANDQIEVVLRAIFHPEREQADEATRQAWLLLGGTDLSVIPTLDKEQIDEVHSEYERRRAAGRRWRDLERARESLESTDSVPQDCDEKANEDPNAATSAENNGKRSVHMESREIEIL